MAGRHWTDICVIGAGSGGLSVAAGASRMGAGVVLLEKHKMGGDCLNYGCVPSKSLIAASHAVRAVREAADFGVDARIDQIDPVRVFGHVKSVIKAIEPMDSVERFEGLGVRVIPEAGRFASPNEVETASGDRIAARRFVIATGSSAFAPPIEGLADTPHMTNETVFEQTDIPRRLIVVGGGPIGLELAQAHRLLGSQVILLEAAAIMPKDDPELVDVVRRALLKDGVDIREGVAVVAVGRENGGVSVAVEKDGLRETISGDHLLVAAGRRPNVDGLGLEEAGIAYSRKGVEVDARLRTSNGKVFAIGDVVGGHQFTHVAGHHAGVVIKNALFRLPAKATPNLYPWVTFTTPELAHVGLAAERARERHGDARVLRWPFEENDRARTEGLTEGFVKATVTPKGRILGASIVGPRAGELIQPWVLAMSSNRKIGAMATYVSPYPTLTEVNKRAAGSFYTPRLFGDRTRKIVRFLLKLP